jgi:CMP-N,N'-diacetyllegionaminic acid synthase
LPTAVALIPARSGSQRVPGKNIRDLAGHPLIAYTIGAARLCSAFNAVVVSTDSSAIAEVAERYGAEVPELRPAELASATSPDIDWVEHMIGVLGASGRSFDAFSILRPTSPFRLPATIKLALQRLVQLNDRVDSIRAVRPCREHPGKMWVIESELMHPLLEQPAGVPYHSRQYQDLPQVYVQSSSLEVAWSRVVTRTRSISGSRVAPFLTDGAEGFSIDYPDDWARAEEMLRNGHARLPKVTLPVEG